MSLSDLAQQSQARIFRVSASLSGPPSARQIVDLRQCLTGRGSALWLSPLHKLVTGPQSSPRVRLSPRPTTLWASPLRVSNTLIDCNLQTRRLVAVGGGESRVVFSGRHLHARTRTRAPGRCRRRPSNAKNPAPSAKLGRTPEKSPDSVDLLR